MHIIICVVLLLEIFPNDVLFVRLSKFKENIDSWREIFLKSFEEGDGASCVMDLFQHRHEPYYAALFQDFVISENFLRPLTLLKNLESSQVVLSERSLLSNANIFVKQIRDKGLISELEGLFLLKKSSDFFDHLLSNFNLKPTFIFLYDSIHPTWLRMKERAREGEQNIQHEHLGELLSMYNSYFKSPLFPYRCICVNLRDFALGVGHIPNGSALCEYIDIGSLIHFLDREIYGS